MGGGRRVREACENRMWVSMCGSPIENVTYIWVNIWFMLDWISSQNCKNTLPLHTVDQRARSAKTWTLLRPSNCLQEKPMPLLITWKNFKNLGLVVILHCLNSFQRNYYVVFSLSYVLLKENRKINAINPPCKVWPRLWTGECFSTKTSTVVWRLCALVQNIKLHK